MTTRMAPAPDPTYRVLLPAPDDFDEWRDKARQLVMTGCPPERIMWESPADASADLFAAGDAQLPPVMPGTAAPRVPKSFLQLAQSALLHSDSGRFALCYRVLWRLQHVPGLLLDKADTDIRRMEELARHVRRDIHKMRAFVRFRLVEDVAGDRYVAWFEPDHHILRANAGFFVRRFATMHWSILTPRGCLYWDGDTLVEGPPATRADAPAGDPTEALWRSYYASTFNPARLKVGAMLKEMPRRYWKNLPEAALIPELIAGAQAREARMVDAGAAIEEQPPESLASINEAINRCRRCEIGCNGTRAVAGEGPPGATLMIVGEQPGDQEELAGRPFVGPAGQLLRQHLAQAGIGIEAAYTTNAVKHFKFSTLGKRRLHQSPSAREVDTCRWWLEGERSLVQPRIVLGLGASASRGLLGRTVNVQQVRGRPHALDDGSELWITTHPSYLLRLGEDAREDAERKFAADLRQVAARLAYLRRDT